MASEKAIEAAVKASCGEDDYESAIRKALDAAAAVDGGASLVLAEREACAEIADAHKSKIQINEPLWHDGQDWAAQRIAEAIRGRTIMPVANENLPVDGGAQWNAAIEAAYEKITQMGGINWQYHADAIATLKKGPTT